MDPEDLALRVAVIVREHSPGRGVTLPSQIRRRYVQITNDDIRIAGNCGLYHLPTVGSAHCVYATPPVAIASKKGCVCDHLVDHYKKRVKKLGYIETRELPPC